MIGKALLGFAQRFPMGFGALLGAGSLVAFSSATVGSAIWTVWPDVARYEPMAAPAGFLVSMVLVFIMFVLPQLVTMVQAHVASLTIAALIVLALGGLAARERVRASAAGVSTWRRKG
jgi:hypothetical protein